MFKTNILFTGFYGQLNTGDDSFVEVASWGAEKYWNKTNNRFLAINGKLPKTIVSVKGYPFTIPKTYQLQSEFLLDRTQALIYAGGSTIHSKMSENSIRLKALKRKMNTTNKVKVGGIGVSVGPFKTSQDEEAVKSYLRQMDFLAVRDQASFDFVNSLDLPYKPINAFDLAALLPQIYSCIKVEKLERRKKVIGISVCPYESIQRGLDVASENRRNTMIIDLLKEIDRMEDIHFRFYIINGNDKIGDRGITHETISRVEPQSYEIIEYSKSTQSIWRSIADCDFIISTRLHAAIFACFSETPFMLNEYHRKCTDFLYNVEYEDRYRLFDSQYNIKEKALQILEVIYRNQTYHFPKKMEKMKERAKLNFTQINL